MSNVYSLGLNGGLYLGTSALQAAQVSINTTGNNISNVNTPGYARERADLTENTTVLTGNEVGSGVSVSSIEGLRSTMLDNLVQQSLGNSGYADNNATLTSTVQDALGETFTPESSSSTSTTVATGSGAIQSAMTTFFTDLQNVANSPTDTTVRAVAVQDGQQLTSALSGAYSRLQNTQSQVASDAKSLTTQINQLSSSIATLNQQIVKVQAASGQPANDLISTRQADIESLSSLVNVTTAQQSDGSVTVSLADSPSVILVQKGDSNGTGNTQSLSATFDPTATTPLTISASSAGVLDADVPSGGSLGADLNVANNVIGSPAADGNTGLLGALDGVASSLISAVNSQNASGYDLHGNAGGDLFSGTGAADIAISSNVQADPSLIAASSSATGTLDGSNALAMSKLINNANILPAFQSTVSDLGQTVSNAATAQTQQDAVTQQFKTQRDSVSGVSMDEEMTNLINFQNAYEASARFINTISSLYNTLVNNTGTP
jgi:flagellar hook-associated protein 1 FlgK